ncbi:MFS transporter [Streptacidiphilus sp. EB129]|uniref:MFS transporter n=1 Tax=Streptacidiphilus sp. EB129 TaxID=3156262 RepID=UPI003516888F
MTRTAPAREPATAGPAENPATDGTPARTSNGPAAAGTAAAGTAAGPRAGRREWAAFGVLVLPLLLVSMDVSVLYFAVPFIGGALHPSSTQQLWILDMYGFVLAGLLITMGALGDRIGRRKLLLIGAAAFGAASVLAAYSTSAVMLIGARALLGVGGATLMPSTLGLIRSLFKDEAQRAKAVTAWTGVMTGGIALGPVLSGVLLEHFWWGSVFLVNLPAMALLLVLGPLLLPETSTTKTRSTQTKRTQTKRTQTKSAQTKSTDREPFDIVSSLLSLAAILPTIYGIKELANNGLAVLPVVALVAGLAVGVVFVRRQYSHPGALLDMALFRSRAFSGALLMNTLAMVAMVGIAVFTTQYLEAVLGLSPLVGALWSLLPSVTVGGCAPLAAVLAKTLDRAVVLAIGFVVAAAGLGVMTQAQAHSGVWLILLGASLEAGGLVMVMSLVSTILLSAAPEERAGTAAALMESFTEFGGACGMALLGTIGAAVYRGDARTLLPAAITGTARQTAQQTLGGAESVAAQLPGAARAQVLDAAREAFVHGMHAAALGGAALMLLSALLAVTLLRRRPA